MNSGGGQKEDFRIIFIEAPEAEATAIFYSRYGHRPDRVSCTCCGEDYAVYENDTLLDATGYYRGCEPNENDEGYTDTPNTHAYIWEKYRTQEEYEKEEGVLFLYAEDVKEDDHFCTIPAQGWVWNC